MSSIGLVGAHRTGKSTLTHKLVMHDYGDVLFSEVPVSISQWQREYGYDSSNQNYSWKDRKVIQARLLHKFEAVLVAQLSTVYKQELFNAYDNYIKISERTPLDLIGYLILNAPENLSNQEKDWVSNYIAECISLTNAFYDKVFVLQPGIAYVDSPTSAKEDSIEKLNAIYLSLILDSRLTIDKHIIDSNVTDINDRVTEIVTNL